MRTVVEKSPGNIAIMDVFSKLVQERIIFIDGEIHDELANDVIAQMLYLNSISSKTIDVYINTSGGEISAGLAIYDVSKTLQCNIRTTAIGQAASMGAILLLMGKERRILKHTRVLFHQPSGGVVGTTDEINLYNKEIQIHKDALFEIVKENTNITDINEIFVKDTWLSATEALEKGVVDKIL